MMDSLLLHAAVISWSVQHRAAAGQSLNQSGAAPAHTSLGQAGRVCKYIPTKLFLGICRGLSNGNGPRLEHSF